MIIRTNFINKISWDLNDTKGFGHPDGNVRLGAGLVWSIAHKSASEHDRFVVSGWGSTVGVIGWSIGGGRGPLTPGYGFGVDNMLEVDVILPNGTKVTANAKNAHSDLFWALRGGGGSTWGIITAITVKAHKIPKGGFTKAEL